MMGHTTLFKKDKTLRVERDLQFVLAYTYKDRASKFDEMFGYGHPRLFEKPINGVLILKSSLEGGGISPSRIKILSLKTILNEKERESFIKGIDDGKIIFLISVHIPSCRRKIKTEGNLYVFWRRFWREMAKIKQRKNSLIIVGGPTVTASPEFFMKDKIVDIIVLGEGETFIPRLLEAIRQKKFQSIPGAYVLKNKNYIFGGKRKLLSPTGIYESQKAVIKFLGEKPEGIKKEGVLVLEFSRGCLFDCNFCVKQLIRKNLNLEKKEYLKIIAPRAATDLIKIAMARGFEEMMITSDSFLSFPTQWLKEFLKSIKEIISFLSSKSNTSLYFYASPVDFQKSFTLHFVKELSHLLKITIQIGFEGINKKTLSKFNKPHSDNSQKLLSKILSDLKPLIMAGTVQIRPSIIIIHPWVAFGEWRKLIKFAKKFKFQMGGFINFMTVQNYLRVEMEGLKILDILKNENLFLSAEGGRFQFKFVHAKGCLFPKDGNDNDISRFANFLVEVKNNMWGWREIYKTRFSDPLKYIQNGEKIRNNVENQLFDFFLEVLDEAEGKWPKLKYEQYRTECQKKLRIMEKIMENAYNTVSVLRGRD